MTFAPLIVELQNLEVDGESSVACKSAAEAPRFDDARNVGGSRSRLVGSYSCLGSSLPVHFVRQQNLGSDCSFLAQIRSDSKPTSSAESPSTPPTVIAKKTRPGTCVNSETRSRAYKTVIPSVKQSIPCRAAVQSLS